MDNCSQPGSIDKVYSVIRVNAKFERGMSRKGRNSQQSRTCNQTMQGLSTSGASLASLGEREKHDSLKRERERERWGASPDNARGGSSTPATRRRCANLRAEGGPDAALPPHLVERERESVGGDGVNSLRWGNEPFSQPRNGPHELRDLRSVVAVGLRARVPPGAQTPKQASKQERERERQRNSPGPSPGERKKERERSPRLLPVKQLAGLTGSGASQGWLLWFL